jgi:cell division protein FtsL
MTDMSEKKMVSRNVTIALGIICIALAALLVGSVYTLNNQISSLEQQVKNLENERRKLSLWLGGNITYYESKILMLNAEIIDLQNQADFLRNRIASLEREIDSLKAPQLHEVEVYWEDYHPLFGKPYIRIHGSIFNSGVKTAYNVICTVRIYDKYNTILKTEEIHLGNIDGKSYKTFDEIIEYYGDADHVTTSLSFG